MDQNPAAGANSLRAIIDGAPVGRFQLLLVAALLCVLVVDGVDLQLLSLVSPLILEEWELERSEFGIALAAALVGMSLGAVLGGALGDRWGRRRLLVFATVLFGTATIAAGATNSVAALTALRLISGLGFGAAAPNAIALASDWLPGRLRPQVISLLSVGPPAGGMAGAALAVVLLPHTGWRGAFYVCGALTFLLAVGLLLFVRESPSYHLAKGAGGRARALVRRHLNAELAVPSDVPRPSASPDERAGETFLSASYLRLNVGGGIGFFALSLVSYAFIVWTPILLSSTGFSVEQSITASFAFNLSAVAAALLSGAVMGRFGTKRVLRAAAAVLLVALLALGSTLESLSDAPSTGELWTTYGLVGLAGAFAGAGMASLYTLMAAGYPASCRAGGLGFGLMMARIGGILASFFGGYLLDVEGFGVWPFVLILAGCAVVGMLSAHVADRHMPPASARHIA